MKNSVTEIFKERDINSKRYTSFVLLEIPEKKSYVLAVPTILHSIDVYCTLSKIQQVEKLLPEHKRASTADMTQNESSRTLDRPRPLLLPLVLKQNKQSRYMNAKKLQDTCYSYVLVHKEEKETENKFMTNVAR